MGLGKRKSYCGTVSEVSNEPEKVRRPLTVPAMVKRDAAGCSDLQSTGRSRDKGCELLLFETRIGFETQLQQNWRQDCIYWKQPGQYFTDEIWMAKLPNCFWWVSRRSEILSLQNISKVCGIVLIKFLNSLLKAEVLFHICHNWNSALSKNIIPSALIS